MQERPERGEARLVRELSKAIQEVWETSELAFLGPHNSIRFLGMELMREAETSDVIHVYQIGYITELLRTHNIQPTQLDRVPITKKLDVLPDVTKAGDPDPVREAQQSYRGGIVGVVKNETRFVVHNFYYGDSVHEEPFSSCQYR